MPPARRAVRALAAAVLPEAERVRYEHLPIHDAGHGYDVFGLHPDWVAMGAGLLRGLYRRWFRVESHHPEHLPARGPAILAANHGGTLPFDGAMLYLDVLAHTDPPRVARPVADRFVTQVPFVSTIFARGGVVTGSRANVRRLLEAGELLMIFPEGTPGIAKPRSRRYRLEEWRVGHAELAIRHRAPVVPVAIIGPDEQWPTLLRVDRFHWLGAPYLPIPATPFPLPVRYHIHYGAPLALHERYDDPARADDPAVVAEAAAEVRAAVEALVAAGLRERRGIFR